MEKLFNIMGKLKQGSGIYAFDYSNRKAVEQLSTEEFSYLKSHLPYLKRIVSDLEGVVKDVHTDRTIDYLRLAREANKRFDPIDIALLEFLLLAGEGYSWHIERLADAAKATHRTARLRLRRLARLGLTKYTRGGFTEDGDAFGSGYGLADRHRDQAQDIVTSYLAKTKQTTLIDEDDIY